MFLAQIVKTDGIPFNIVNPKPSKDLLEVLKEADNIMSGKVKSKGYKNIDELKKCYCLMTKYEIKYTSTFKKNLKKLTKQNKDLDEMFSIIRKIANKEKLDHRFKCHIELDWLLIYQYNENELILLLVNNETHSELFN